MKKRLVGYCIAIIMVLVLLFVTVCIVNNMKIKNIKKYIDGNFFVGTNTQDLENTYQFIFCKGKVAYQIDDPWHKGKLNIETADFDYEYRITSSPFTSKVNIEIFKNDEWEELVCIYTKLTGEINIEKMEDKGLAFTKIDFSKIEDYTPTR